jgi:hypothetical protein
VFVISPHLLWAWGGWDLGLAFPWAGGEDLRNLTPYTGPVPQGPQESLVCAHPCEFSEPEPLQDQIPSTPMGTALRLVRGCAQGRIELARRIWSWLAVPPCGTSLPCSQGETRGFHNPSCQLLRRGKAQAALAQKPVLEQKVPLSQLSTPASGLSPTVPSGQKQGQVGEREVCIVSPPPSLLTPPVLPTHWVLRMLRKHRRCFHPESESSKQVNPVEKTGRKPWKVLEGGWRGVWELCCPARVPGEVCLIFGLALDALVTLAIIHPTPRLTILAQALLTQ